MILSKNNIIVKIENLPFPEYTIFNPVSGSFDIMNATEYEMYLSAGNIEPVENDFAQYLLERGYAYENPIQQEMAINSAYEEFKKEISESQVQLILVPTYGCNLACTYCFQHGVDSKPSLISKDAVDSFFRYAKTNFSDGSKKPFITLFGGEPLVNSDHQREIIEYIICRCIDEGYELSVVSNGYDLVSFIGLLGKAKIKEIQITLDGSKEVHDKRRATANSKGTFDRIVEGIDAAVKAGMPINLRTVADTENIRDITNLAELLDRKGWLDLPPEHFKTQIGRNYELFDCYAKPQHLMSQVELWREYALLSKEFPILSKFHRPDFKGIRHLVDTGEMYMASFDTCPACKTEWVFDLYGNIYGCTASCGREEYLLGTYWPYVKLNEAAINTWKKRDVKSISGCRDCAYDVICGGGCGVVAANKNHGEILSPDCRPIQQLMDIGINYYIDEISALSEEKSEPVSEETFENKACCGCKQENESEEAKGLLHSSEKQPEMNSGCVVCGKKLVYKEIPTKETCSICGLQYDTPARCVDGHYICDSCHSGGILGKIERLLSESTEAHPVALAQKIFELPRLKMHGPEYHSIVPAVIVAAWQNSKGSRDDSKIREAIRRGTDIRGGSCGFNGNCGAGVGSGIAMSIIKGSSPMSRNERGDANMATGHALIEISTHGGPRCCKREAITSIESFIRNTGYFTELQEYKYTCSQYAKNKDCILKKCPYFPAKS